MNLIPIEKWFAEDPVRKPLLIAGPCSAETEAQVIATAEKIAAIQGVAFFRAGVWKPRTRPGSFEGVGDEAFKWLKRVKRETGLRTCIEVATAEHLHTAVANDVDAVWLGARTVANPFAVQLLADALIDYNLPVMVKNPINPELELWQGAIERISRAGITKIAAIHRGFYPFEKTDLRNVPKWEIPIELKLRLNNVPVIGDPSHIAGSRQLIRDIAQKALDVSFEGLMIETHIDPGQARTDARQQLTPGELENLLNHLRFHRQTIAQDDQEIELLREQVDSVDNQMIELLAKIMELVDRIGQYKKEHGLAIFQLRRWKQIIGTRNELGRQLGLDEAFIKKMLQLIHEESIMRQNRLIDRESL